MSKKPEGAPVPQDHHREAVQQVKEYIKGEIKGGSKAWDVSLAVHKHKESLELTPEILELVDKVRVHHDELVQLLQDGATEEKVQTLLADVKDFLNKSAAVVNQLLLRFKSHTQVVSEAIPQSTERGKRVKKGPVKTTSEKGEQRHTDEEKGSKRKKDSHRKPKNGEDQPEMKEPGYITTQAEEIESFERGVADGQFFLTEAMDSLEQAVTEKNLTAIPKKIPSELVRIGCYWAAVRAGFPDEKARELAVRAEARFHKHRTTILGDYENRPEEALAVANEILNELATEIPDDNRKRLYVATLLNTQVYNGIKNKEAAKAVAMAAVASYDKKHPKPERRSDTAKIEANKEAKESGEIIFRSGDYCVGLKDPNEDAFVNLPDKGLFAVCDGVGGAKNGHKASSIATETLRANCNKFDRDKITESEMEDLILEILNEAKDKMEEVANGDSELIKMKTTVSLVKFWRNKENKLIATVANLGDSRVYKADSNHVFVKLIKEDSAFDIYIQEWQNQGWINEDEERRLSELMDNNFFDNVVNESDFDVFDAKFKPLVKTLFEKRNEITQSLGPLGVRDGIRIEHFEVKPGDRFIITSDGIHDNLTDSEIAKYVASRTDNDAKQCAERLGIEAKRRSQEGGMRSKPDDTTAVVIDIEKKVEKIPTEAVGAQSGTVDKREQKKEIPPEFRNFAGPGAVDFARRAVEEASAKDSVVKPSPNTLSGKTNEQIVQIGASWYAWHNVEGCKGKESASKQFAAEALRHYQEWVTAEQERQKFLESGVGTGAFTLVKDALVAIKQARREKKQIPKGIDFNDYLKNPQYTVGAGAYLKALDAGDANPEKQGRNAEAEFARQLKDRIKAFSNTIESALQMSKQVIRENEELRWEKSKKLAADVDQSVIIGLGRYLHAVIYEGAGQEEATQIARELQIRLGLISEPAVARQNQEVDGRAAEESMRDARELIAHGGFNLERARTELEKSEANFDDPDPALVVGEGCHYYAIDVLHLSEERAETLAQEAETLYRRYLEFTEEMKAIVFTDRWVLEYAGPEATVDDEALKTEGGKAPENIDFETLDGQANTLYKAILVYGVDRNKLPEAWVKEIAKKAKENFLAKGKKLIREVPPDRTDGFTLPPQKIDRKHVPNADAQERLEAETYAVEDYQKNADHLQNTISILHRLDHLRSNPIVADLFVTAHEHQYNALADRMEIQDPSNARYPDLINDVKRQFALAVYDLRKAVQAIEKKVRP